MDNAKSGAELPTAVAERLVGVFTFLTKALGLITLLSDKNAAGRESVKNRVACIARVVALTALFAFVASGRGAANDFTDACRAGGEAIFLDATMCACLDSSVKDASDRQLLMSYFSLKGKTDDPVGYQLQVRSNNLIRDKYSKCRG